MLHFIGERISSRVDVLKTWLFSKGKKQFLSFSAKEKVSPIIVTADGLCHSQQLTRPAASVHHQPGPQAGHTLPDALPWAKTARIRDQVDGVRAAQKLSGKSRKFEAESRRKRTEFSLDPITGFSVWLGQLSTSE